MIPDDLFQMALNFKTLSICCLRLNLRSYGMISLSWWPALLNSLILWTYEICCANAFLTQVVALIIVIFCYEDSVLTRLR